MRCLSLIALAAMSLTILLNSGGEAAEDARLEGVWIAQSMEADGKPAPPEAVKKVRFTFKGEKLLIRGNFSDDREDECDFQLDPKQSPKHLDFTPPKEGKPVLAIYEIKGDELKICTRNPSNSEGRPTRFTTKAGSGLALIIFKRQKP